MSGAEQRRRLDKYYTKSSIVDLCGKYIAEHLRIERCDLIIEPSAGDGAFLSMISSLSDYVDLYDIEPEHDQVRQLDFLSSPVPLERAERHRETTEKSHPHVRIHAIGNPPFGRQASLARQFIKKAAEFCDTLSFILPRSFKKDSMKVSFPSCFHMLFQIDLPGKSFLVDGKEYDVPCVFQIWERRSTPRACREALKPVSFAFVKKGDSPDVAFRRVGSRAGSVTKDISVSESSHYFIKFSNDRPLEDNIAALLSLKFEGENTVAQKSISKQELVGLFEGMSI